MLALPYGFEWKRGVIPEGRKGLFEVKHHPDWVDQSCKDQEDPPTELVTALYYDGGEIMTDATTEAATHAKVYAAPLHGSIVVSGLGIGFINQFLILNENIKQIVIVEKFNEVVDLVWPHCVKDDRFELVVADVEKWEPDRHFDFAWFDSWIQHNPFSPAQYATYMRKKYAEHCDTILFWVDEVFSELGLTCFRPEGNAPIEHPVDDNYLRIR